LTKSALLHSLSQAHSSLKNKRKWQLVVLALGLLLPYMLCVADNAPNIIIILVDDMGFSDLGSYGGEIHTPNIVRLAKQGIRFTKFYNTARCSTTRASLLTGQYPHNVQMGHLAGKRFKATDGYRGQLDEDATLLPEWLKTHGYKNYMLGKWHLADWSPDEIPEDSIEQLSNTPLKRGFDQFYGTLFGGNNYFGPKFFYQDHEPIKTLEADFYYTDALSCRAVQNITAHLEHHKDQPFFIYLAYTAPRWPLQAPAETIKKYREVYFTRLGRASAIPLRPFASRSDHTFGFSVGPTR
jgi:arylsulfatase A-like enzyme